MTWEVYFMGSMGLLFFLFITGLRLRVLAEENLFSWEVFFSDQARRSSLRAQYRERKNFLRMQYERDTRDLEKQMGEALSDRSRKTLREEKPA